MMHILTQAGCLGSAMLTIQLNECMRDDKGQGTVYSHDASMLNNTSHATNMLNNNNKWMCAKGVRGLEDYNMVCIY